MPLKFKEQEKVLCFHGPLLYEAKVSSPQIVKRQFCAAFIETNQFVFLSAKTTGHQCIKISEKPKEKIVKYLVHYQGKTGQRCEAVLI